MKQRLMIFIFVTFIFIIVIAAINYKMLKLVNSMQELDLSNPYCLLKG